MVMGGLNAPGARLPVSTVPSFNTTRCVTVSMLCQTIFCPAGSVAGFGENDCAPLIATTLTVTTPDESTGGADAAVLGAAPYPLPLHAAVATAAAAARQIRITFLILPP